MPTGERAGDPHPRKSIAVLDSGPAGDTGRDREHDDPRLTFGQRLRQARMRRDWSQSVLAHHMVQVAADYRGPRSWRDREKWLTYSGPSGEVFHDGKRALDAARRAGVFTVGSFAAIRPSGL